MGWYIDGDKWWYSQESKINLPKLGTNCDMTFICKLNGSIEPYTNIENDIITNIPFHIICYNIYIANEYDKIWQSNPLVLSINIKTQSYVEISITKIIWYKNEKKIHESNVSKNYRIDSIDCAKHIGVYKCEATFSFTIPFQITKKVKDAAIFCITSRSCIKEVSNFIRKKKKDTMYAGITFCVSLIILFMSIFYSFYVGDPIGFMQKFYKKESVDFYYSTSYYYPVDEFQNVEFSDMYGQGVKPLKFDYSSKQEDLLKST
ncbi:unnamed protein product [Gordionus sp. m RMFG-2023]